MSSVAGGPIAEETASGHEPDLYAPLERIDWTFEHAHTRGGPHGIHPYPAKFIPQIPRALIEQLHPGDGTAVLDPFCGSGTTLVEAARAGHAAVGIDLHPLACLITRVKTAPAPSGLAQRAADVAASARRSQHVPVPPIPRLDHWFRVPVQRALAALVTSIEEHAGADARDALAVALSSIIVRVSNQESDTRYAAIDKTVGADDVFAGFTRAASQLESALTGSWPPSRPTPERYVINANVLDVAPGDVSVPVSLVVTSPPYPNAYEYWLYHKYRMYWLGMDPIAVREQEIGARPHYFRKHPATADDFERQLEQVFSLLAGVLVRGGHACFQVADSMIRGEVVDNSALLRRAAGRSGFVNTLTLRRRIPLVRKAFNPANSRIRREEILVFRSEGG